MINNFPNQLIFEIMCYMHIAKIPKTVSGSSFSNMSICCFSLLLSMILKCTYLAFWLLVGQEKILEYCDDHWSVWTDHKGFCCLSKLRSKILFSTLIIKQNPILSSQKTNYWQLKLKNINMGLSKSAVVKFCFAVKQSEAHFGDPFL